ncbi:Two-on-two hemoglobin-3 [Glycine soja]|uniref:Two-on-two hemoglobin-3 n=1 Tax=Glycine soja TaxID=3848 RepID=A0A445K6F4_GLYSO|nr:hypothetical protein JHK87_014606 [Glycine soja]RZC06377.1 Two-on-two hemoglobin-3 [Glycine soja]
MQSLQHKASEWSGVSTADAFTIDEAFKPWLPSLPISTTGCIYDDEEEWFRSIFANSQNQYEFLVQRMGGPTLYSQFSNKRMVTSYGSSIGQYLRHR